MNISPAIGAVLGSAFGGPLVDKAIVHFAKRNSGIYEPEMRLRLIGFPAIILSAGTLLYGLTVAKVGSCNSAIRARKIILKIVKGMPWPINSVGAAFMSFGLGGAGDILITYLQDAYTKVSSILGLITLQTICLQHTALTLYTQIIGPAFVGAAFIVNICA